MPAALASGARPPPDGAEFAALMARLGPFEPRPRLAVAVSGGADSLALALLAAAWAAARGGNVLALIVDHGLRAEAAREAAETANRLKTQGIPARVLRLAHLAPGPGLAARARAARYAALGAACRDAGLVHLLLGHHAADQAETVLLRALSASGPAGMDGMAALSESDGLRLLRPLLGIAPVRLRALLLARGLGWAEDPSNADPRATRARLRLRRADRAGDGPATLALGAAAQAAGMARAAEEAAIASLLAARAELRPEGFALLDPAPLPPAALGALLRVIAGADHAPAQAGLAALAAMPRPATLGGARLMPAGRLGPGRLLVLREAVRMAPPVPARPGAVWDGRFRLMPGPGSDREPRVGTRFGALGAAAAAGLRGRSALPAAVLATLPALWRDGTLLAVPTIGYDPEGLGAGPNVLFAPRWPVAGAPFLGGCAPPWSAQKA